MFFKLSLRNVKRSYQDYAIYFITLILAISVFYVFNSLSSQEFLVMVLQGARIDGIEVVENIIIYLSMFIAVILGFLIIYANNFLFRRRKKELGIYLTLGMERRSIAGILLSETLMIGGISLGVGIGIGVLLSQAFGIIVIRMMNVHIEQLNFIFSWSVMGRTILYFGIMFLAVIILNILSMSRYKIINLIHAGKQRQKLGFTSSWLSLTIFILAVAILAWAYKIVLSEDAFHYIFREGNILPVVALGIIGTLLLFLSLAGFLMVIMKVYQRFYYKNLNIFTLRQISNRIQTNWISVAIICLMIFVSICSVGVGMALKEYYQTENAIMTPFDVTINIHADENEEYSLEDMLDLSEFTDEVYILSTYIAELTFGDLFDMDSKNLFENATNNRVSNYHISEVNPILAAQGIETFDLEDDEVLMVFNSAEFHENELITDTLEFDGKVYNIAHIVHAELLTGHKSLNDEVGVVFPNHVQLDYNEYSFRIGEAISFHYKGDFLSQEARFIKYAREVSEQLFEESGGSLFFSMMTKNALIQDANMTSIAITFISFYLGIIFILVSMAMLALQQLIDAVESTERYSTLSKIGVDDRMRNQSLLTQIGMYFVLPLLLAGIHSVVGLLFFYRILVEETTSGRSNPTLIIVSFAMVFGVYLLYFIATYWQYKRVLRGN